MSSAPEFESNAILLYPKDAMMFLYALRNKLNVIPRDGTSVIKGAPLSEIFGAVRTLPGTHCMWINACHPFLSDDTIIAAARKFLEDDNIVSMTSVVAERSSFWDESGVPIKCNAEDQFRTDKAGTIYRCCHAFHIWPKEYVLDRNIPWAQEGPNDPYLWEIVDELEAFDIDTERSLKMAGYLYEAIQK